MATWFPTTKSRRHAISGQSVTHVGMRLLAGFLAVALCGVSALAGAGAAPPAFGTLLREADALRSSDAKRFADRLAALKGRVDEASVEQQQRHR